MKALTEVEVRARIKKNQVNEIIVKRGTIITPSAREYLNEKKIKIKFADEEDKLRSSYFEKKPENMTQLYKNELVSKNHPNIIFRGKLDSLQSKILEIQVKAHEEKSDKLVKDLQEVLQYVRNILKAEVIKEEIEDISLLGLNDEDLRKMSHFPKKYIGVDHILPDYKMGKLIIGLNSIRSRVRETELSSIVLDRNDIIKALNRLSSGIYIMMCRYLSGYYD